MAASVLDHAIKVSLWPLIRWRAFVSRYLAYRRIGTGRGAFSIRDALTGAYHMTHLEEILSRQEESSAEAACIRQILLVMTPGGNKSETNKE